jgi:hypothetical protein
VKARKSRSVVNFAIKVHRIRQPTTMNTIANLKLAHHQIESARKLMLASNETFLAHLLEMASVELLNRIIAKEGFLPAQIQRSA